MQDDSKDLSASFDSYPMRKFSKGSTILHQGEVPRSVYVIRRGVVKVYTISHSGEEQIATFYTEGDIMPATWLNERLTSSLYYHEAMTDCLISVIPRQDLLQLSKESASFKRYLTRYYMTNYVSSLMRITALQQPRATDKVLYTLYYLLINYGSEPKDDVYELGITLTQQMIANLVGLTRETTSIELQKLKRNGVLSISRKHYSIKRSALVNLIGEDNFRELAEQLG